MVAYIRFVSVYRKFEDVESFVEELNHLRELAEQRNAQAAQTEN